jgi:DNA-binding transcriptional ArsR family regulator
MSSIFPLRDTVTPDEDREPRLVDLDEDTADEVFEALSSETTRTIFMSLHRNPQTASDLAEETDTSVQNVQYHLGKLKDADLVAVVDTWYSERGTEMKVYAPKDDSLVLFAGRDKQSTLRSLLNRVTGLFALLVPVSVLAGLGARWSLGTGGDSDVTVDAGDIEGDSGDVFTGDGSQPSDDGELGTSAGEEVVDTDGSVVDSIPEAESADGVLVGDNGTAYVFDNETAWELENATVTERSVRRGTDSVFVVDGDPGQMATETTFVVSGNATDPGSNVTVPAELADGSADTTATIAGLDPGLAVGAGVLLGGLLVAGALAAWYGTPDGWTGQTSP